MGATSYGIAKKTKAANAEAGERKGAFAWVFGAARVALGGIFLWAFLDKLFGLGYTTKAASAWINGGSPTKGYLSSSVGPLAEVFKAMAGHPVTNALFMFGLAAVGIALILGVAVRLAGFGGATMMAMMYASHPPYWLAAPPTNPVIDDHVVYGLVLVAFALSSAGHTLGFGRWWSQTALVRRFRALE